METKKSQFPQTKSSSKSETNKETSVKESQLMELFEDGLKDLYWAEKALVNAIPKLVKNATSQKLNDALTAHLEETKEHVARLEEVFGLIELKPEAKKCDAMSGLIEEASSIMESCDEGAMRDAGIIAAAQKVEHYEIASYGTLCQFAETLKLNKAGKLLATTLQEEKEADSKLSGLAMDAINADASKKKA